jgi:hypothetical protein
MSSTWDVMKLTQKRARKVLSEKDWKVVFSFQL